jgi:negative regulator of replication initiation
MIIQIIGSAANLKEDLPFLHDILEIIHDDGAVIARDWISAAQNRINKNIVRDDTKVLWDDVHKENSEAITRSDIVIIEATNYGFQEGFYTSQALQEKKPVLLLTRKNIQGLLVHGIHHKLLSVHHYDTEGDLKKIVAKFIKSNTVPTKDLRFNFFIDRHIYSYLREVSHETGKSKSEIIRELLEEEIDRKD